MTYNKQNSIGLMDIIKGWKNIAIITLVCLMLAAVITVVQPLKYGSDMKLLVVQEYSNLLDPYSASKSTRYLSDILSQVVYSTGFYNEVMNSGFAIDQDYFSDKESKRKKQWETTISARASGDTGIINITAYHTDKVQAEQIARAVAYTLRTKHGMYHGAGDKVSIRVLENAITSNWPVKPNAVVNLTLALVLGILLGASFVYFYPEYEIRLWPKKADEEAFEYSEPMISKEADLSEVAEEVVSEYKANPSIEAVVKKDNWSSVSEVINKQ